MSDVIDPDGPAADPSGEAHGERTDGVVVFTLGGQRFGVRIEFVREIVHLDQVTPIYRVDSFIRGVTNLRGQVVVVCDVTDFLGLGGGGLGGAARGLKAILLTHAGRDILIVIERECQVHWFAKRHIIPPPPTLREDNSGHIEAVIQEPGQEPVALLDIPRFLADERWGRYA